MHIRVVSIRRNGLVYKYAQLVEREYKDGKAHNLILKHIGPVKTKSDVDKYKKEFLIANSILQRQNINLNSLNLASPLEFGVYYATRSLLIRTGIAEIIEKYLGDCAELAFLLIATRLGPISGAQYYPDFLDKIYYPWLKDKTKKQLFRTLDIISNHKDDIENEMFMKIAPTSEEIMLYVIPSRFVTFRHGNSDNSSETKSLSKDMDNLICVATVNKLPVFSALWDKDCDLREELKKNIDILTTRFAPHNPRLIIDLPKTSHDMTCVPKNWKYLVRLSRWINPFNDILANTALESYKKFGSVLLHIVLPSQPLTLHNNRPILKSSLSENSMLVALFSKDLYEIDHERFCSSDDVFYVNETGFLSKKKQPYSINLDVSHKKIGSGLNGLRAVDSSTLLKLSGKRMLLVDNTTIPEDVASIHKFFVNLENRFSSVTAFTELKEGFEWKDTRKLAHLYINTISAFIGSLLEMETRSTLFDVTNCLSAMKAITMTTQYGPIVLRTDSHECDRILERLRIQLPGKIIG